MIKLDASSTPLLTGKFYFRGSLDSCREVARLVCPNVTLVTKERWVGNENGCRMQGGSSFSPGRQGECWPSKVTLTPQPTGDYIVICESGKDVSP